MCSNVHSSLASAVPVGAAGPVVIFTIFPIFVTIVVIVIIFVSSSSVTTSSTSCNPVVRSTVDFAAAAAAAVVTTTVAVLLHVSSSLVMRSFIFIIVIFIFIVLILLIIVHLVLALLLLLCDCSSVVRFAQNSLCRPTSPSFQPSARPGVHACLRALVMKPLVQSREALLALAAYVKVIV